MFLYFANILYNIKGLEGRKNEEQKKERVSCGGMKYDCRDTHIPVCEYVNKEKRPQCKQEADTLPSKL
jgi:hypothetical protein